MIYNVIMGKLPHELADQVNKVLAEGWQLVGGVTAIPFDDGEYRYYQAVCIEQ